MNGMSAVYDIIVCSSIEANYAVPILVFSLLTVSRCIQVHICISWGDFHMASTKGRGGVPKKQSSSSIAGRLRMRWWDNLLTPEGSQQSWYIFADFICEYSLSYLYLDETRMNYHEENNYIVPQHSCHSFTSFITIQPRSNLAFVETTMNDLMRYHYLANYKNKAFA